MMQNDTLSAMKRVVKALQTSGIVEPLKHIRQASKESDASDFYAMLLGSFSEYSQSAKGYNEQEKRVCAVMELSDLSNERFWADLLAAERPNEQQLLKLYQTHSRVTFALNHLPALVMMMEDKRQKNMRPFATVVPEGQSVLAQTIMPLHGNPVVDTEQLAHGLEAVGSLYRACCMLAQQSPSPVAMQDWRSKPIAIFSVMMERQIRPAFDRVLQSIGALVVDYNTNGMDSVLSMLHQLPELDAVDKLYNRGSINRDAVEDFRHLLINGSADYLLAGCVPACVPLGKRSAVPALVSQLERELQQQQLELQGATTAVDLEVGEGAFPFAETSSDYYDESLDRTMFDGYEQEPESWLDKNVPLEEQPILVDGSGRHLPHAEETMRFEDVITEDDIDNLDETAFYDEEMVEEVDIELAPPPTPETIDDASFTAALESLIKENKSGRR